MRRAFLKQREDQESDLSKDSAGIFKDPLMDTVYGQVQKAHALQISRL